MIVHAELTCMNCGYEMVDVEGQRGAPVSDLIFMPVHQGDQLTVDKKGVLRCPRCRGRVLPHGVTPVKRPLDRTAQFEAKLDGVTRGLMY